MRVLRLTEIHCGKDHIAAGCALDDLRFHATVWYEDLDLAALARQYGEDLMQRIAVHVALFQLNAVASLRPDAIDLGPWSRFGTPELAALWKTVFRHVWAQWRWQHDLPDYVPEFAGDAATPTPARLTPGPAELLALCGGGKDSLVALKLLERAGLPFATLGYAHSIYGAAAPQHALIERVASASARVRAERQWVLDDVLDAPVAALRPELGVRSILAAETPASVFAALPIALARGYRGIVVAHEASANTPNLVWKGEPVNHQWGKSWEAEQLLDRYVQRLVDVRYFSVLAPVHDEVILELLARDAALAPLTHSCNVRKPWCGACAKCAYVWLQFAAHLPPEIVRATFGFEPAVAKLRALLEQTPLECVGSPAEARLAVALARPSYPQLAALDAGSVDAAPLVVVGDAHGMPAHVAAGVMPQLHAAAAAARERLVARGLL